MSSFEPMTESEIRAWWDGGGLTGERMARTALHYLADRDAVTVERDEAKEACDLLEMERDDACGKLDDLRADLHNVRAHSVAAEEARDLAIVERDEAYKQRDAMRAERDAAIERADSAEEDAQDAGRAASNARRARERVVDEVSALETQINDARAILGAAPEEMLSDAAARVMMLAESEPPQVFRTIPRVVVEQSSQFNGRCVRIEIVTSDPAVLALTADQLSRLGLVVCDE